jgi:large subunit ribosomal protein L3
MTLSVPDGLDYDKILSSKKFGITNQSKTFKSFEDEINKNFGLEPSAPVDRLSKRVGLVGYKVGMTHFWDKWGKLTPCTVIQVDRVQVTQIKTFDKDGVNAI